jgi:PAP2 superfamily
MKIRIHVLLLVFGAILFFTACEGTEPALLESPSLTHKTTDYTGAMAHEWMQMGYQMAKDNFFFGPHAARTYGYLGLTIWESVYGGIPGAKSMAGQINEYRSAPAIDIEKEYDWGIVLCSAMREVFPALIENISPAQKSEVGLLADLQERQMMAQGVSEEVRVNSRDLGLRVGAGIVKRMRSDGRDVIRNIVPVLPARTGATEWYWDPATLGQSPVEPMWGTLRTFVLDNAQSCEAEAPFAYSEDKNSVFYKDAKEVFDVERSAPNKAIAYHWENGPGRTCSPACHWVNIAEQLLKSKNSNLAESAKTYALVGFAAADGFSNAWYLKYKYNLLRPITYLHEQMDPNWKPMVGTPPYPDYTSGSSTIGGAAPVVLASVFGDIAFTDKTHLGSPLYTPDGGPFILPERSFASLTKAGEEQALSRILGGVHFRRACDLGLKSGRCIGNTILNRLDFGY